MRSHRHGQRQLDDPVVEERAAALEAVRHARHVDLDQEVAGQVRQQVGDHGAGDRVAPRRRGEGRVEHRGRVGLGGSRRAAAAIASRSGRSAVERQPGGLVEGRHPAQVARRGAARRSASSSARTLRSRVFARAEPGSTRAIGPPSTARGPARQPVEAARPAPAAR